MRSAPKIGEITLFAYRHSRHFEVFASIWDRQLFHRGRHAEVNDSDEAMVASLLTRVSRISDNVGFNRGIETLRPNHALGLKSENTPPVH